MEHSCLGFAIECDTLWKGAGVTIMGFTLFIFSTYLLLTAIFGRWLGLPGARGVVLGLDGAAVRALAVRVLVAGHRDAHEPRATRRRAGVGRRSRRRSTRRRTAYAAYATWPGDPWAEPDANDPDQSADVQSASGAVTAFLAEQTNEELGLAETDPTAVLGSQFAIDSIRFAEDDGTKLAVVQSHFTRRRTAVDRLAVLRRGQRAPLLVHVPGRLDRGVRGVPAAAWIGPRRSARSS